MAVESEAQRAELQREVDSVTWYHTIDLGNGVVTRGMYDPRKALRHIGLPERLDGLTVLDVGAHNGYFSFEAERRGAARVLATDSYEWATPDRDSRRGFELAHRAIGSSVEDMNVDVMELSPERVGTFDLVLFLGVLYHLRDPITALERVASVTGNQLIVESVSSLMWLPVPAARLFPADWLCEDPTSWWALNRRAVLDVLRSYGFTKAVLYHRTPRWRMVRSAAASRVRGGQGFMRTLATQRATFHAWR